MAFARPTLQEIRAGIAADLQSRLAGADGLLRRSVIGIMATVLAGAAHGLYGFLAWIARQIFPDTAEAESLARWASIWGVDRKPAWPAAGGATFTGTNGAAIAAGTRLRRTDGVEYLTTEAGVIAGGSLTLNAKAVAAGAGGNAAAAVSLRLVNPIAGVQSAVTVAAGGLVDGADIESDATLLARLLTRIQEPPHGGALHDWRAWTLDRAAHGVDVTAVWPAPQEMGAGTMTIRFMMHDAYANGIPLSADLEAVEAHLDVVRPVTVKELFVVAPVAVPIAFDISGLDPVSQDVRDAIEAELRDLLRREARPGGTVLISHIREAISIAAGERDHALVAPAANVESDTGEISTFGDITWS